MQKQRLSGFQIGGKPNCGECEKSLLTKHFCFGMVI